MTTDERIKKALGVAVHYGGTDGDHHKARVIDQMVRALTGCPFDEWVGIPHNTGESDEYRSFVAAAKAGEDGPNTYDWDTGIAP